MIKIYLILLSAFCNLLNPSSISCFEIVKGGKNLKVFLRTIYFGNNKYNLIFRHYQFMKILLYDIILRVFISVFDYANINIFLHIDHN